MSYCPGAKKSTPSILTPNNYGNGFEMTYNTQLLKGKNSALV